MTTDPVELEGTEPGVGPHQTGSAVDGAGGRDACAACGEATPARPGGSQVLGGRRLVREIGSCRHCGLQLVRFEGERWREIRG